MPHLRLRLSRKFIWLLPLDCLRGNTESHPHRHRLRVCHFNTLVLISTLSQLLGWLQPCLWPRKLSSFVLAQGPCSHTAPPLSWSLWVSFHMELSWSDRPQHLIYWFFYLNFDQPLSTHGSGCSNPLNSAFLPVEITVFRIQGGTVCLFKASEAHHFNSPLVSITYENTLSSVVISPLPIPDPSTQHFWTALTLLLHICVRAHLFLIWEQGMSIPLEQLSQPS